MNFKIFALLAAACLLVATAAEASPLSPDDTAVYRRAFETAAAGQPDAALAVAANASDPLLTKVLRWKSLQGQGAGFGAITEFLADNPDWPLAPQMERRAEAALASDTPPAAVLAWFRHRAPQTTDGVIAFAQALAQSGDTAQAATLVRSHWTTGAQDARQESALLAIFGRWLTPADDAARLDRLLWDQKTQAALRQAQRVDESARAPALVRIALQSGAANGPTLAAQLSAAQAADPGVTYDLVRFYRQHDQDDRILPLLQSPAADRSHPDLWWTERAILARHLVALGRMTEAYDVARHHRLTDGATYAEAEWLAGWIALRFLGDPTAALPHFQGLYERVATVQSRARAAYWTARSFDVKGEPLEAARWYAAAAPNVTTFYGQLASEHLHPGRAWTLPPEPAPTPEERDRFERQEMVQIVRQLAQIQETRSMRPFLQKVTERAGDPGARVLAATLAGSVGLPDLAVMASRRSERDGTPLATLGYPLPDWMVSDSPERALQLALIRQESAFQADVISPVGARGLMQLMPATAARVAKGLHLTRKGPLTDALTTDPALNVSLGSAYLNGLLTNFSGSYILAVAAYNAGPVAVSRWIRDLGDPRSATVDAIDWIEQIPFSETRNYVQRVLEGVQVYRHRLGMTGPRLSLDNDIKRWDRTSR